jgi:hypothetical protein
MIPPMLPWSKPYYPTISRWHLQTFLPLTNMPAQATVTNKNNSRLLNISGGSFRASLLRKRLPPAMLSKQ